MTLDLFAPAWRALLTAMHVDARTVRPLPAPIDAHYFYSADDAPRLLLAFPEREDEVLWAAGLIAALPATAPCLRWHEVDKIAHPAGNWAIARVMSGAGEQTLAPTSTHCEAIGIALAQLHLAARDLDRGRANAHGPLWWREYVAQLAPTLRADAAALLREELRVQALHRFNDLPRGLIHGEPVRANAWWRSNAPRFISLDRACTDLLLFDVALAVDDWCTTDQGALDTARAQSLLSGYNSIRALTALERGAWPVLLRAAALQTALHQLQHGASIDAVLARLSYRLNADGEARRTWPSPARHSACA